MPYKITDLEMEALKRIHRALEVQFQYDDYNDEDEEYFREEKISEDFEVLEAIVMHTDREEN